LGLEDGEAEDALRDVAIDGEHLVANEIGPGSEVREGEHEAVRLLAAVDRDGQGDGLSLVRGEGDMAQTLLELAVEAEVDFAGRLRELRPLRRPRLEHESMSESESGRGDEGDGAQRRQRAEQPRHMASASRRAPGRPDARS